MAEETKKTGRPKGSKNKSGVPIRGIKESIDLTKMAYDKGKDDLMSFSEISGHMGLQKGSNAPIVGALNAYGFLEQSGLGWKVSELGKRAMNGEKEAVRSAFEKIDLFRELSSEFGGKNASSGLIEDYLKKKYRKGENVKLISRRFSEGMDYIQLLGTGPAPIAQAPKKPSYDTPLDLIELKYALKPTEQKDTEALALKIYENFKDNPNKGIKVLAQNIKKNKKNNAVLMALVDSLLAVLE